MEKNINNKILIVGGTGFIGSHLVRKCSNLGWNVTSLSLKKRKNNINIKNVNYIYTDFTNLNFLKKKIKFDFDYIVNLGGYIDHSKATEKRLKILKNHFQCTLNLTLLSKKRLKRYLHIGTSDEYGYNTSPIRETSKEDPISFYALAKLMSLNFLLKLYKNEKFPVTILRLFLVYGPNQKKDRLIPYVISNCLKNKTINLSHGRQLRDFCYVDDVIEAIILCLRSKKSLGQIFNVGSGNPISIKKMVKKIVKVAGHKNTKLNFSVRKKEENLKLYPSIRKIKNRLGWKPKISLNEGLTKTVNFFRLG